AAGPCPAVRRRGPYAVRRQPRGNDANGEVPYRDDINKPQLPHRSAAAALLPSRRHDFATEKDMRLARFLLSILLGYAGVVCPPAAAAPLRADFTVESDDGMRLFVRALLAPAAAAAHGPLLLVKGGRSGVLASWAVEAPGTATAEAFARAGHEVYLMDVRGFGRSSFPREMAGGRHDAPVAVRS